MKHLCESCMLHVHSVEMSWVESWEEDVECRNIHLCAYFGCFLPFSLCTFSTPFSPSVSSFTPRVFVLLPRAYGRWDEGNVDSLGQESKELCWLLRRCDKWTLDYVKNSGIGFCKPFGILNQNWQCLFQAPSSLCPSLSPSSFPCVSYSKLCTLLSSLCIHTISII